MLSITLYKNKVNVANKERSTGQMEPYLVTALVSAALACSIVLDYLIFKSVRILFQTRELGDVKSLWTSALVSGFFLNLLVIEEFTKDVIFSGILNKVDYTVFSYIRDSTLFAGIFLFTLTVFRFYKGMTQFSRQTEEVHLAQELSSDDVRKINEIVGQAEKKS